MSYTKSNLADAHYGYDMVTGVTESSVNATMMQWLSGYQSSPFVQAYVYNPETQKPSLADYTTLKSKLGFDPFSIPNDTPASDARIEALKNEMFMFAFKIEIGLPDFPLEKIPPLVVMDKEGSTVTYNMVCKTFKIIDLQASLYGSSKWINLDQSDCDAPWQIQFNVDLNLVSDSVTNKYHLLPPEIQKEIKNLGENLFSVQQLYFDLNAAKLSSSFQIVGLDPTSTAFTYLSSVFINNYVRDVASKGGIMLGFGVVSNKPFPNNVSLVPTDLNFVISSYKDANGKSTDNFPAYTLNYLIMSDQKAMPPAVPFAWNWVDSDNLSEYAGSVAINRNTFANFLNNLLSPSLKTITNNPSVKFSVNLIKATITESFSTAPGSFRYNVLPTGGSHILTYSFSKTASDSDTFVPNWGNYSITYSANADVYLKGTQITHVTRVAARCHLNVEGGVTEGDWAVYSLTTNYTIGVDAKGRISVTQTKDPIKNLSQKPDPNWWSKLISLGTIDNAVNHIQTFLQGYIQDAVNNESNRIAAMLNGSNSWVFPGGKTFSFQDAEFSEYQDMIAHVLYADPTN